MHSNQWQIPWPCSCVYCGHLAKDTPEPVLTIDRYPRIDLLQLIIRCGKCGRLLAEFECKDTDADVEPAAPDFGLDLLRSRFTSGL